MLENLNVQFFFFLLPFTIEKTEERKRKENRVEKSIRRLKEVTNYTSAHYEVPNEARIGVGGCVNAGYAIGRQRRSFKGETS